MNPKRLFGCLLALLLAVVACPAHANPLAVGSRLPDIVLPLPEDQSSLDYLGLSGEGTFEIPQIDAEIVIVEIFSMY
ncbi:hypothetical protein D3OALGA1CA_3700 [Olavius algarvensis associated proteobacterium Delta 3]|nr:hypothetical protein D3OALGA1CA_3700 [Olavius algarvensis associated proteobacterium Delta 3]CAB5148560.1 hypothetical protein D3OALGB2SA_4661 [Olavius algarvensis associated proteobacterium Delta 3]